MSNYQKSINAIVEGVRRGESTVEDIETRLQIALAGADVFRQALTILRHDPEMRASATEELQK